MCRANAETAPNPLAWAEWLALAAKWQRLADEVEGGTTFEADGDIELPGDASQ
jgi:hypothetical protein